MSALVKEAAELMDALPESDQQLAYELIKKMVLAWDPDFTKVTASEQSGLVEAEAQISRGETVPFREIDWE